MIIRRAFNIGTRTKITFGLPFSTKATHPYDLLYGINPVQAAIHANRRQIVSLMVSDSDRIQLSSKVAQLIHQIRARELPVIFSPKERMSRIVDQQPHQNLILKCSKLAMDNWNAEQPIPQGVSIYCDKITDPQNFGAVIRSALFFGAKAVFTGKKHHCPLNTTVSKTSSGAMELMKIVSIGNSSEFIQKWKSKKGTVISTGVDLNKPHTTAHQMRQVLKSQGVKSVLLILGAEGTGVSPHLLSLSDFTVAIQRKGNDSYPYSVVDSLNVSAAASTLLFELTREI